jgi:Family of unknown function (DUF6481)
MKMANSLRSPPVTKSGPQKNTGLNDRLATAAAAKKAMLERFKAQPGPEHPVTQARQAALKAVSDARNVRSAERTAAKEAEVARQVLERATMAADQAAREAEEQRLADEASARAVALEAERKAARDARYAARKARR